MEMLEVGIYILIFLIVILALGIFLISRPNIFSRKTATSGKSPGRFSKISSSNWAKGIWWWIKIIVLVIVVITAIYGLWMFLEQQPSQDWGYLLYDSPITSTGTGETYKVPRWGGDHAFPVEENPDTEIFRGKKKILLRNPGNKTIYIKIPLGACEDGKCEINAQFSGNKSQKIETGFELRDVWSSGVDADHPNIYKAFNYTGWRQPIEISFSEEYVGWCIEYPSHNEENYVVYQKDLLINRYGKQFSPEGREYEVFWTVKLLPGQEIMIYKLSATGG